MIRSMGEAIFIGLSNAIASPHCSGFSTEGPCMIKTDDQRRWWFATHPEFSSHGRRSGTKKWEKAFGRGAADRDTNEKHHRPTYTAAEEAEYLEWLKSIEQDKKGLESDPHTFLDLVPYRRFLTTPIAALKGLLRSTVRDAVIFGVKGGRSKGPGEWVEVTRSPLGLQHQSIMSGKPITERDGRLCIQEYRLNNVKFDDYKNGKLYEYKGLQGNLLNKDGVFPDWCRARKEAVEEAERQLKAAQGIPIVWKVGITQVKAYRQALGEIPGIKIVP